MDPLLDLVRAMRLSGGVFLDAEFTSPWCVSSHVGPEDYGAFLPAPAHVIAYHYVTEGRLLLRVGGGAPVSVGAGEIILLPRNEPHQLGAARTSAPVSVDHLVQPATDGRPPRIVYGGGGERTRMLCGFLGSDSPNPPIASVLPRRSPWPSRSAAGAWIESSFRFAAQELGSEAARRPSSPGSRSCCSSKRSGGTSNRCRRRNMDGSKDCAIRSSAGRWRCSMARARIAGPPIASHGSRRRAQRSLWFRAVMGEPPKMTWRSGGCSSPRRSSKSREAIRGIALEAGYE